MASGSSSRVRLVRCPGERNQCLRLRGRRGIRMTETKEKQSKVRVTKLATPLFLVIHEKFDCNTKKKNALDTLDVVEGGNETVNSNSSSGTQKEDDFGADKGTELKVDRSEAIVETGYGLKSGRPLKIDLNGPKSINSSMEGGLRENPANSTRHSGWPSLRMDADQWNMIGEWFEGFPGNSSDAIGTSRIPSHAYVDDGSSNHQPRSYFEHSKPVKSNVHINGLQRGEILDLDAELLRKCYDLKNHISRISGVPERTDETVFLDREGPSEPFDDKFNMSLVDSTPGKPVLVHPHCIHHRQHHPIPSIGSIDQYTHDFYLPPIPRSMATLRPHHQFLEQAYQGHLNKYMDLNRDFSALDLRHSSLDCTLCTCSHCHEHEAAPQSVQPTPFGNKGSVEYPMNSISHHHRDPIQIWPRGHLDVHVPPLSSRYPWAQRRWPAASIGSDRYCRFSAEDFQWNKKHYHPISGGAPFITCCKCSELLTLPSNVSVERRKKPNLQCGSCSTVLLVEVLGKRVVTSIARKSSYLDKNGSHEAVKEKIASLQRCLGGKGIDFLGDGSAIDICAPGHGNASFHENHEANEESDDQQVNMQKYEQSNSLVPSSHSYKEKEDLNEVKHGTDLSTFVGSPLLHEESSTLPSLTFTENLDNSSSKISEDQYAEESEMKEIHWDFLVEKGVTRQKSVLDTATETEIEYSFNDYLNASQDSSDASKEADRLKTKRRDKSYFSRSNEIVEIEKPDVVINGHPIPKHLVEKAEKLAGPILPGRYWYDFQGGFWGVMGGPCLGIVLPFIKEFNYPMPANCAAGNTGVFVNGRELHQKDLELLASRGLPTVPNRFYKIEISGRVWDEKSGKRLYRLGKLAPKVERAKRGFGINDCRQ
ncbi:LOW QUALITY PROTEIN: hypothetical protein BT93_D2035 [Corymbia citriodora subsp. variegata]|nr:LOW QUALITY PROTEIN: hypothetical protein BT93_D2035 [Corymbia citriodora subsp. variegata]